MNLTQRLTVGGITLELSACVSDEALQAAFGLSSPALTPVDSPIAMLEVDPGPLLAAMQPALALALQALRESLVQLALARLQEDVEDMRGQLKA